MIPETIRVIVLAVVQGIAEFLPISSSGHLVILGALLGELDETPTLEIILHAGTLGSILIVYWRRILDLLRRDRRLIGILVVGTIPAAIVGLLIKSQIPWLLRSPLLAGAMLVVTGSMLWVLSKLAARDGRDTELSYAAAAIIGTFQAFAILPGISRSGSTILGGRLMGLAPQDSVTFSFLLAIPAIGGATVLTARDLLEPGVVVATPISTLLAGAAVALVVGVIALRWLIRWTDQDRLHWFAYWCVPVGLVIAGLAIGQYPPLVEAAGQ